MELGHAAKLLLPYMAPTPQNAQPIEVLVSGSADDDDDEAVVGFDEEMVFLAVGHRVNGFTAADAREIAARLWAAARDFEGGHEGAVVGAAPVPASATHETAITVDTLRLGEMVWDILKKPQWTALRDTVLRIEQEVYGITCSKSQTGVAAQLIAELVGWDLGAPKAPATPPPEDPRLAESRRLEVEWEKITKTAAAKRDDANRDFEHANVLRDRIEALREAVEGPTLEGQSGTCPCGQPGTAMPDPYRSDLHGDHTLVWLCSTCADASAAEI